MSDKLLLISADSHAGGAPEDYRDYIDPAFRDRIDDLIRENEEFVARGISQHRYSPEQLERMDPRRAIRDGGYEGAYKAAVRLKEIDAEGVAGELLNPGHQYFALPFFSAVSKPQPPEVRWAGARAYHRWLSDFMSGSGGRLKGTADSGPCYDMAATVQEIHWAAEHGFAAIQPPGAVGDPGLPPLSDAHYDPFWAACVDAGLPVYVHIGHGMPQRDVTAMMMSSPAETLSLQDIDANEEDRVLVRRQRNPLGLRMVGYNVRRFIWQMIISGALDRHPGLKVVIAEIRSDWVAQVLAHLDAEFERGALPARLRPSEYWARNFYVAPSSPRDYEIGMRHETGLRQLLLATDYPHPEGTWPNTREWLRAIFAGVPEAEARLIMGENALACFPRFDGAALRQVAERIGPTADEILRPAEPVSPVLIEDFDRRSGYLSPKEDLDVERLAAVLQEDLAQLAPA